MADEQPKTPSAEPSPAASADVSASVSESTAEQPSKAPSWWQRLLGREPEASPDDQEPATSAEPAKVVLTEEELERRVQAETDRREAKRRTETEKAERRRLRDEDPWKYAEQDRKAEQEVESNTQVQQFVTSIGLEYDRVAIDPIIEVLPKAERERVLGAAARDAANGLEHRRMVVGEAMKALEKHWRAEGAKDAEDRLRKNPAFRKQILVESRGQYTEPELLPSGPAGNGRSSDDINDMLRRQIGIHRET
jgi:hypothetical protein